MRKELLVEEKPLISIGMSVWNNRPTIATAIHSIIAQTYTNWELILIDDGSRDGTMEIVHSIGDPRIRAISYGRRSGLPARLNEALDNSRGVYFARMDGDDVAYPSRLEKQLGYLTSHPEVDLVGAGMLVFSSKGRPLGKRAAPEFHEEICNRPLSGFPLAHPTYMGRVEWFQNFRYDEKLLKAQDQDLLLRSFSSSRFANVPEILQGYREERVSLKKIFLGRSAFVRSLLRECSGKHRLDRVTKAVAEQVLKGATDCIAVGLHLEHLLLPHRTLPITPEEAAEWGRLWGAMLPKNVTGKLISPHRPGGASFEA